ncbi:hypothetical protein [Dysgonomonas sp. GY617]|uniref:hypothetical protein n=1 Tax=Dysgonomonas sp. GY617 TaxID=2780420 RepID=UPI0018832A8C|nr:hypothetical protein [Dysgonomonas sp. GY617]MBF0576584.1 hypothetical protein [Dysgonomonas sp. GY617]
MKLQYLILSVILFSCITISFTSCSEDEMDQGATAGMKDPDSAVRSTKSQSWTELNDTITPPDFTKD